MLFPALATQFEFSSIISQGQNKQEIWENVKKLRMWSGGGVTVWTTNFPELGSLLTLQSTSLSQHDGGVD